ncbi:MAG TPA: FAD-dependent oxidoreductase, partial [Burkholderiaceae bacterium]
HILIGAYTETLRLMQQVGVDAERSLLRMPLTLRFADGGGLQLPALPAPLDVLAGVLTARGWLWRDKWALLHTAAAWQRAGFACGAQATVAELCRTLTPRAMDELIEPLCVSALNMPAHAASGAVFLRVLRDALFGVRGGSRLLLPRTDLGRLFPEAAAQWLTHQGATLRPNRRVRTLAPTPQGWTVDDEPFSQVVLACPPWEAARLAEATALSGGNDRAHAAHATDWARTAAALHHTAIATIYAQAPAQTRLPQPMMALRSNTEQPAQFVFDRGQLGGPAGLLAFVVSASNGMREELERQVLAQASSQLKLTNLQALQTVVEKRATFACTPNLVRPSMNIALGLWACGDYVQGPYPATLEGAVRSGLAAAQALMKSSPSVYG